MGNLVLHGKTTACTVKLCLCFIPLPDIMMQSQITANGPSPPTCTLMKISQNTAPFVSVLEYERTLKLHMAVVLCVINLQHLTSRFQTINTVQTISNLEIIHCRCHNSIFRLHGNQGGNYTCESIFKI